jgi:hypothetical protein
MKTRPVIVPAQTSATGARPALRTPAAPVVDEDEDDEDEFDEDEA